MKKNILLLFLSGIYSYSDAQKKPVVGAVKSDLMLMMESSDGTNACSVTYNPDKKLYYCFIAGNNDYPLEVFDIKGKNVYTGTIGMDARGLWYNPKYKQLEGTCYNNGYFSIPLTVEGFTQEPVYVNESVKFAGEQSVASFSPANGEIYHFYDGKIHI